MAEVVWTKVHGQDQYKRLARRLREAGRGDLQRKMTREIRRAGSPALTATRTSWRGVDVSSSRGGGESSGLRARVAAATRISVLGSGIRIRVEGKKVDPAYGRALTYYLNDLGRKAWRHPVFGNREVWEKQKGQEVFFKTLERFEKDWRRGVEKAMDDTAREILGG